MEDIPFTLTEHKPGAVSIEEDILPPFHKSIHRHKEMQISLIIRGEGTLQVGSYSQAFKSGNVYIFGANQPHSFRSEPAYFDSSENEVQVIHIYFDFRRIPETFFLLQEMNSIRKFISSCITGLQIPQEYEDHAATLIRKVSTKANLERLLGLLEIFHYFSNEITGWKSLSTGLDSYKYSKLEGNRIKDVFRYTLDNFAENITLSKIASIAHITPHAFCKYFKQQTRKTYNNFLNEVRVNEACRIIISGSYDGLSAIAYKTGFKGASNFNRVFKKATGMSPSDYKKEFRQRTA